MPPAQVWAALTTPESTRQFLFGIRLESTWGLGSPITGWLDGGSVLHGEALPDREFGALSAAS